MVWELAIVTLGVLIALGGQQLVEAIHGRQDLMQLRAALKGELADDRARWEYMAAADRCSMRRLDALDHWVATAPPGARLPDAFPTPLLNLHSSSWDVAKTSGGAVRMPLQERLTYASLYAALENWRELLRNEVTNAQTMSGLFETADQPEDRRQARALVARARILLRFRQASSAYIIMRFDELGVRPDASTLVGAIDSRELCKPLP